MHPLRAARLCLYLSVSRAPGVVAPPLPVAQRKAAQDVLQEANRTANQVALKVVNAKIKAVDAKIKVRDWHRCGAGMQHVYVATLGSTRLAATTPATHLCPRGLPRSLSQELKAQMARGTKRSGGGADGAGTSAAAAAAAKKPRNEYDAAKYTFIGQDGTEKTMATAGYDDIKELHQLVSTRCSANSAPCVLPRATGASCYRCTTWSVISLVPIPVNKQHALCLLCPLPARRSRRPRRSRGASPTATPPSLPRT